MTIKQWHNIEDRLEKAINDASINWKDKKAKFKLDNLLVEYSFVAKSHGIVNYAVSSCYDDKTEWIIKVLIRNPVIIKDFIYGPSMVNSNPVQEEIQSVEVQPVEVQPVEVQHVQQVQQVQQEIVDDIFI